MPAIILVIAALFSVRNGPSSQTAGDAEAPPDGGSRADAAMGHAPPTAIALATSIPRNELRLLKLRLLSVGRTVQG